MKNLLFLGLLLISITASAQPLNMELLKALKPRNIGPAGMSGRVTAIDVVHKNPNVIYIGTASGGLWHSTNGGTSWTPLFQNERAASVGAVAINQNNPNEIWVGTGEGNPRNSLTGGYGLYKTMDGGKTWTYKGLSKTRHIHRVILHPNNPNIVWVAAIGSPWGEHAERGVYKTKNGGKSWTKLHINSKTGAADLVIDPTNPNKLIAAMWEHRRYPWFFKSGGAGSGLYISYDGGDSWEKRTTQHGLPKGELGRMGLAIAPSQPNIVYALIESQKNGLYKSVDGGETWALVSTENIGGRPFYYADIFVDTKNENRIFNLHTYVDISQDGGKTFERFIPSKLIHVDNHAWWQHPDNPNFMICGNDGGLCISRDGGKTWDFPENLPLGQFYHIRIDNEIPYNVYGGMQDNGTWRGPSQVWRRKGIRNLYWNRIGYGDGFDALPDPEDARYGYSMLQGGRLLRYDLATGMIQGLQPFLKNGERLRFNWNAGIAIDPHDQKTLYYGSQYVLKSMDKGQTWSKISPDLTTNDPEKQQAFRSGGLTYDATGAENYTTILTIAPSSLTKGVIWVGTDDGNIQVTQNNGRKWANVTPKLIDGLPKGSWITQIQASEHEKGGAFAVVNNYRRDDWTPYLYYTSDFGKTWTLLVDEKQVWGYCLSVAQDPIEPNLIFLGTEFGLYVSVDKGRNWTNWTNNYPTVSTMDLAIHPREHDLVIGTYGRSIWILDDIRPLRTLATKGLATVLNQPLTIFPIPNAYLAHLGEPNGYRSTGHGLFVGENREQGALITYFVADSMPITDQPPQKATIEILDNNNQVIRTLQHEPQKGMNRLAWKLDVKGIRLPNKDKPKKDAPEKGGRKVIPGDYIVKITYQNQSVMGVVKVVPDPKLPITPTEMAAKAKLIDRHYQTVRTITKRIDGLKEAINSIDFIQARLDDMPMTPALKRLKTQGDSTKAQIQRLIGLVNPPDDVQGIFRHPDLLSTQLSYTSRALQDVVFPVTPTLVYRVEHTEKLANKVLKKMDAFARGAWRKYEKIVKRSDISLLKTWY